MSSDVLIRAVGIYKEFRGVKNPVSLFKHALFSTDNHDIDYYKVLGGIDLTIIRGQTVGIMGRNGAGKTTLLGILGNVIKPTEGSVERFGRISTLLGLTAGFSPNFTGRENAYTFCSIQGIRGAESKVQVEKIEEFADLGKYFDMPLRTYSSGMQARLAFSCAIHVNSDLIIVDETLAVGDSNFKMKCYDRIRDMRDSGQTFLLVSHNQNMIANFCDRAIVLEGGLKVFDGTTFDAIACYKSIRTEAMGSNDFSAKIINMKSTNRKLKNDATLYDIEISEQNNDGKSKCIITMNLKTSRNIELLTINFGLSDKHGVTVCAIDGALSGATISNVNENDAFPVRFSFDRSLIPGRYYISCLVYELIGDVKNPLALYQNFSYIDVAGPEGQSGIADLNMQINFEGLA